MKTPAARPKKSSAAEVAPMPAAVPGLAETPAQTALRLRVRKELEPFGDPYWRALDDKRAYPEAYAKAFAKNRLLAALIPEEYGGLGLPLSDAALIVEEVNQMGGNAGTAHAQMYIMGTLLRHGSPEQKQKWLPQIASGKLRLQAFGVTEPKAGSDTTKIETQAVRKGGHYVVNGEKRWISRIQYSELMLLLARTSPPRPDDRTFGLSTFLVDLRKAKDAIDIRPIKVWMNNFTNALTIRDLKIPAENLVGEEGRGFRYIIDGWNAERILIAAECVGDGRWFVEHGAAYAKQRVVFGRPLGQNQGVQFPLARSHMMVEAADLMRRQASALFDAGTKCGAEANMAKLLASEASWQAGNACMDTYGGNGFAAEHDVERKMRETRLYQTAPINNNLVMSYIAQHVLGLPRSF